MASVQADGGIVSTLADGLAFMDAFLGGRLFPAPLLEEMQADWHRVFLPLEYGTGIMRYRMPAVRRVSRT
jgi:D-alanyl-D-alanine carboxypeptidase